MRKDKLLDQLQNTTPVPDIVLEKREQAFEAIRQREEMRTETIAGGGRMQSGRMQARRGGVRKGILLAAAAVLLIGTLAFAAVSRNWGSLEHSLGLSEEDKETLEKSGVAKGTELAAEDDGITITVQSVAAGRYQAVLSFLVQGVTLPEDAGPGLAVPFLRSVQGKTEEEADWAEYSPWVRFEESVTGDSPDQEDVAYQKGEEIPEIAGEPSVRFLSEEGSLSFFVVLSHRNWEKEDVYAGKRLDLHLEDIILPVLSHGQRQELCFPGSWDFTLTLPEGGEQYQPVLWDDQQENLPVQVTRCEISPLFVFLEAEMEENCSFGAVRLKDGSMVRLRTAQGVCSEDGKEITEGMLSRVVDVSQVQALVFDRIGTAMEPGQEVPSYEVELKN